MIPFNKPTFTGKEIDSLNVTLSSEDLDSSVADVCDFLNNHSGAKATYFCNSCSDALEICALAMELGKDDEVIVPDYSFVTSASSFALRGAKIILNSDINSRSKIKLLKTIIRHIITPKPINLSKINSL